MQDLALLFSKHYYGRTDLLDKTLELYSTDELALFEQELQSVLNEIKNTVSKAQSNTLFSNSELGLFQKEFEKVPENVNKAIEKVRSKKTEVLSKIYDKFSVEELNTFNSEFKVLPEQMKQAINLALARKIKN